MGQAHTTFRYGLLGCGMMGQEHLRNMALLPDVQAVAVYEPDAAMRSAALALAPQARAVDSMEALIDGRTPACAAFSGPYYFLEQLGYRKVIDSTFMMATSITGDPDPQDVAKYFRALRRAQHDIDLRPELYTHYYRNEFPQRFHDVMDTRRWGPGERIVFEPYSRQIFENTRHWISERDIFDKDAMGSERYEDAIFMVAAE